MRLAFLAGGVPFKPENRIFWVQLLSVKPPFRNGRIREAKSAVLPGSLNTADF